MLWESWNTQLGYKFYIDIECSGFLMLGLIMFFDNTLPVPSLYCEQKQVSTHAVRLSVIEDLAT